MATTKPQGTWIICADRKTAEDLRAKLDAKMGYPRAGTRVSAGGYAPGSPIHVTEHYAPIEMHPDGVKAAVFADAAVSAAVEVMMREGDADAMKAPAPAVLDATWEKLTAVPAAIDEAKGKLGGKA